MTRVFDSHCHLQDRAFAGDMRETLARAQLSGLVGLTVCGFDAESNLAALALAATSSFVFPAVGFHPHDAGGVTSAMLTELEALAALPEVVAVGEIGLDFYRDLSPRARQRQVLDEELAIAVRVGKPVSVHSRGAEDAIYDHLAAYTAASPLKAHGRPVGVMHCFGGTIQQAESYVALGFLVSIPCSITYPNNLESQRIAAALPADSLVVETDSPYLPPQQMRGRRNEPAYVRAAVQGVAAARSISVEAAAEMTTANACRLFGVSIPELAGTA